MVVDVLEALFLAVMSGIADDAERNEGGAVAEFEILAAGKVYGAKIILGGRILIRLGLALCFSGIACATAESLDGGVRGRDGKGLQAEDGIG